MYGVHVGLARVQTALCCQADGFGPSKTWGFKIVVDPPIVWIHRSPRPLGDLHRSC